MTNRLSLETATQLLDFTGGDVHGIISAENGAQQLRGAVAIHNLLAKQQVAYLADEVGMGKTYVALGAVALFRHFDPSFRVLVVAPRENIQDKWIKEWKNFVKTVVRVEDLRVKAIGGAPARSLVKATSLIDLVGKVSRDHDRDFFVRLTSFSVPISAASDVTEKPRTELLKTLPWLNPELLSLRNKAEYRKNFGRAINCALPEFDLVIVDEGHNLKAGWSAMKGSTRNAVLGCALGGKEPEIANEKGFVNFGHKATRVLFLSATPVEDDFRQLWNQLDLVGHGAEWMELTDDNLSDEEKRDIARSLLIRRVGSIRCGEVQLTKNQYRREWRRGGAVLFDEPMAIPDDRQRLAVALVQKKVSEVLGHAKNNHSFQIGLLASFESYAETARAKGGVQRIEDMPEDVDSGSEFYVERSAIRNDQDREGMDIDVVNRLARDHQRRFHKALPHPKMDALVHQLSSAIRTGTKSLVFVRRVASVDELQRKLEECYDDTVFARLRTELSTPRLIEEVEQQILNYRNERSEERHTRKAAHEVHHSDRTTSTPVETSNSDSFFAWFFRGEGPTGVLSGAKLATRFENPGGGYSTFFEDNYVAGLLRVQPSEAFPALASACNLSLENLRADLSARVLKFLKGNSKTIRRETFQAYQQASLELLAERSTAHREASQAYLDEIFLQQGPLGRKATDAPEPESWLSVETLFTTLRNPGREELRESLWPDSNHHAAKARIRENELRRMLFSTMARKGHPIIDLFVIVANNLDTIVDRRRETVDEGSNKLAESFLNVLDVQRVSEEGDFHSYAELSAAASSFQLIITQNLPEVRDVPLSQAPTLLGRLLRAQRPIGGMAGVVNKVMVRQFRMPGYPLVLVSTDLLAEGEDLHTFCSNVVHYGIAWMPSALEQRVGRVDRVGSQSERRLLALSSAPRGSEKLQVFYPHLRETVEVLQVQRVLHRLNRFMRLMHTNLGAAEAEQAAIDVKTAMTMPCIDAEPVEEALVSAFDVTEDMLHGRTKRLSADTARATRCGQAFIALKRKMPGLEINWQTDASPTQLVGTRNLGTRVQPFTLLLRSMRGVPVVRCVSPVGDVKKDAFDPDAIQRSAKLPFVRVSVVLKESIDSYEVATEGDVVFSDSGAENRVSALIRSVTTTADEIELAFNDEDPSYDQIKRDLPKEADVER